MKVRLLLSFLSVGLSALASHIVGSDIYYDYLGNNNYRIYVTLFRDCFSTGADYDNPMSLGIFKPNGDTYQILHVPFTGRTPVPIDFNNPCISAPTNLCVERSTYTADVSLPASSDGYVITYQRCCYGPAITNVVNPGDIGLTITTRVPGNPYAANSSPRFVNFPPLVICNNVDLNMMHNATDADGDLVTYDFVTPFNGGNSIDPQPDPPSGPSYVQIPWEVGYSAATTLGPGASTTLDANTGALHVDANQLGKYVVGIRAREYRNGVLIGETVRAFIFNVINCVVQLSADINAQASTPGFVSYCHGTSWTFDNLSFGGSTYHWDFGDPTTAADTSNVFEPGYTYPGEGVYTVMLVVNPGWPCTDTAYTTLQLYNPLVADFTHGDSVCASASALDFDGELIQGDATTTFSWKFPSNATPQTSATLDVQNVHFSSGGTFPVIFVAEDGICYDSVTKNVTIYNDAVASFDLPDDHSCIGRNQNFINTSQFADNFQWDFGDPAVTTDISNATNPSYFYDSQGSYTITLIANNAGNCPDTTSQTVQVNELMELAFTHEDSVCVTGNEVDFLGTYSGPTPVTFNWNFGDATPSSSNSLSVSDIHFLHSGNNAVTLTAHFDVCEVSVTEPVHLFAAPIVNFRMDDMLQCAPFTAQFIDMSYSESPLIYTWDFGDGTTSGETSPEHVYSVPGSYVVTLSVVSTAGCVDTLTMTNPDLINVHPKPTADFKLSTEHTDICNAAVQFTDLSVGADFWYYRFGDMRNMFEQNPLYTYVNDGTFYPQLIVTSEFGCKDSVRKKIEIEPFPFYVPNAFTPDYNQYNQYFGPVFALTPSGYDIKIFDRWGEIVFESTDPDEMWDGTYNNLKSQDGVYTWKIVFSPCDSSHGQEMHTGHVTLLR